jgi:tryptophan synthase beta chain
MVREFQRVIGKEARAQILEAEGRLPDAVIACVGGGSNAIGVFAEFIGDEDVKLIGVEAAGRGLDTKDNAATLNCGRPGILHGAETMVLQNEDGQVKDSWSISAGLDYPAIGPEHVHLKDNGRAQYVGVTDDAALSAFATLARSEGILCAFESAHALAHAFELADQAQQETILLVNLSGRGDKDVAKARDLLGTEFDTLHRQTRPLARGNGAAEGQPANAADNNAQHTAESRIEPASAEAASQFAEPHP